LVLLVGKTFKIGELLQQFLLLVGTDGVVDDFREVGCVVTDPMRSLEIGASLTVIAVIVVFFGSRKLVFDVLRSGSPGIKIRLTVIGGGTAVVAKSVVNAIINAAMNATRRPDTLVARCVSQDDIRPLPLSAIHNPIHECATFAIHTVRTDFTR
jgi:hypothetical protein